MLDSLVRVTRRVWFDLLINFLPFSCLSSCHTRVLCLLALRGVRSETSDNKRVDDDRLNLIQTRAWTRPRWRVVGHSNEHRTNQDGLAFETDRNLLHKSFHFRFLTLINWSRVLNNNQSRTRQQRIPEWSTRALNRSNQVPLWAISCAFHSFFKVLFTFPSQYFCAIGLFPLFSLRN